jgi:hypothetical protein
VSLCTNWDHFCSSERAINFLGSINAGSPLASWVTTSLSRTSPWVSHSEEVAPLFVLSALSTREWQTRVKSHVLPTTALNNAYRVTSGTHVRAHQRTHSVCSSIFSSNFTDDLRLEVRGTSPPAAPAPEILLGVRLAVVRPQSRSEFYIYMRAAAVCRWRFTYTNEVVFMPSPNSDVPHSDRAADIDFPAVMKQAFY